MGWSNRMLTALLIGFLLSSWPTAVGAQSATTRVVAGTGPDQLNRPAAVLVHDGSVWVADLDNHRIVICEMPAAASDSEN